MFKRIKENEKYIKLKELWKNPKTHSLIVLGFWLVFMIVVVILVRGMSGTSQPVKTTIKTDSLTAIKNYEFSYTVENTVINGQAYNDKLNFYINNNHYYYNEKLYLINGNDKTETINDINILKISPKLLNNLISGIKETNINNSKQYLVPLDRFVNLYEIDTTLDLTTLMNYNIMVNIFTEENKINKIILDLTNYMKFKGYNSNYILTIYYYNINNVSNFAEFYDKIGEKK